MSRGGGSRTGIEIAVACIGGRECFCAGRFEDQIACPGRGCTRATIRAIADGDVPAGGGWAVAERAGYAKVNGHWLPGYGRSA